MKPVFAIFILIALSNSSFAQIGGISVSYQPNEITPNIFMQTELRNWGVQWNPAVVTIVPNDPYNPGRSNVSSLSFWTFLIAFPSMFIVGEGGFSDEDMPLYRKLLAGALVAPYIISNFQIHYTPFEIDTNQLSGFRMSGFTGIQSNYFGAATPWYRFSPAVGLEFVGIVRGTEDEKGIHNGLSSPVIAIQIGAKKDWDLPTRFTRPNPIRGFFQLKLGLY